MELGFWYKGGEITLLKIYNICYLFFIHIVFVVICFVKI